MRGLIIGACLLLPAWFAWGQETTGSVTLIEGGFAPGRGGFSVTCGFSDMKLVRQEPKQSPRALTAPGIAMPADGWSSAEGATARLELCCVKVPMGLNDVTLTAARLRVTNPTDHPFHTTLAVAVAPRGEVHALAFERHSFLVEGRPVLIADTPSRGAILAESPFAARSLTPQDQAHVESVAGECRGEMLFDLVLMPGQTQTLGFVCPPGSEPTLDFYRTLSIEDLFSEAQKQSGKQGP
jgi:hypothetical protein